MVCLSDRSAGVGWSLLGPEVTLGRAADNHIVLDHPSVSRHHARISLRPEGWLLEDLGSSAGTAVNGVPITQHWLLPGDMIALGPVTLHFELEPTESPAVPPPASPRRRSPLLLAVAGCGGLAVLALGLTVGVLLVVWLQDTSRETRSRGGGAGPPQTPTLVPADVGAPALAPLQIVRGAELARQRLDPRQGGEVVAGTLRLSVPPGALDRKREVTVYSASVPPPALELALLGGRPRPAQVLAAWDVDLGEGAGQLPGPVEVAVDLKALACGPAAVVLPMVSLDGRTWTRLRGRVEEGTLRFASRHFCAVSLVGLLEAAGYALPAFMVGYLVYDRAREFPSQFSEYAPFVSCSLTTDPEGFEISWSTQLDGVDAESGLKPHDPAALVAGLEALVREHQQRAGEASTDPRHWALPARRELAAAVDRYLAETLIPDPVREAQAALVFARLYLIGRHFDPPLLDLPVYIAPKLAGDTGFLHNPWSGRRYVVLSAAATPAELWTTALHELFHHFQTGYVWVDRTGHLPLMEASALLLEREATPDYRAAGKPFDPGPGQGLAQLLVFHHGLDGPADWQEAPVRRFGYGLSWFLEELRDRAAPDPAKRAAFHAALLRAWSDSSFSALRAALTWAAGGDEEKLRTAYRAFAREAVLRDLEHDAGARGPIGRAHGCSPFEGNPYRTTVQDSGALLRDVYGFDPTVLDFAKQPLQTIAEPRLRPWSIQFYRCAPPGRANATLVLRVPKELTPAEGPAVDVYLRAAAADPDPQPVAALDRAPAGSDSRWASLPFDGEHFVYLVDTGLVGGWVTSAPPVSLMLLEPPTAVSLAEQGGVVTVSWTPPALAGAPGVPLGFRVEVVDGPRWTMVVPGDRSSTQVDYRGSAGRAVAAVAVATVLEIGRGPDGQPVYLASAPASASTLELRGQQSVTVHGERVDDTVQCDNGKPPLVDVSFRCEDMPTTVDAAGSFSFACGEHGEQLNLSGRGRVSGDRLHLEASVSRSQGDGEPGPETSWERTKVECTVAGDTRLRAYREEGSVGIEKGLRGTCTSSLDRQEMVNVDQTTGFAWVETHQRCTAEVALNGSFIPVR